MFNVISFFYGWKKKEEKYNDSNSQYLGNWKSKFCQMNCKIFSSFKKKKKRADNKSALYEYTFG